MCIWQLNEFKRNRSTRKRIAATTTAAAAELDVEAGAAGIVECEAAKAVQAVIVNLIRGEIYSFSNYVRSFLILIKN